MKHQFQVRVFSFISILSLLFGALGLPTQSAMAAPQDVALQFDGSNDYVTFGAASGLDSLGVQVFTIETWFKKTGNGITVSTGSGGITALPLVTKGRGEGDGGNVDMNYFFGIDSAGRLAADFEECAPAQTGCPAGGTAGLNHPATGSTVIQNNIWYHAAVTFNGQDWKFYLNGVQDGSTTTLPAVRYPRWDSLQHAGIGTAMTSTGAAAGFFNGVIDETRIWNVVRTQAEISAEMNNEVTSGTGLIGRWGLNEGTGTTAANSVAGRPNGTLTNGPVWATTDLIPPAAPTGLVASPYSGGVSLTWTANTETDLAGYNLYRSTTMGGPYAKVNTSLVSALNYTDGGLTNGTPYYYVLRAEDTSTNESSDSSEVSATPLASLGAGLSFDGINDYVTFGPTTALGSQNFTVETWFKRTASGTSISTGTNGVTLVPLVAKGAPQGENSNVDENYILGIRASDNVLAGDFEIFAACNSRPAGDNNPIVGVTPIVNNTWYHAAFTYDGIALNLYLNGNLEGTLASTCIPRYDNTQPAALGTTITTAPLAQGFFAGVMDEVRIWSVARTQAQILADINNELTSGTNLIARWGMNEGTGTSIASSVGTFPGTLTNGPLWVAGAPFNIASPLPPGAPTLNAPADGATGIDTSPTLDVSVSDPNSDPMTVTFFGRPYASGVFNQIGQNTGVVSGTSSTKVWANLDGGQEYEWYVTVSDGTVTTTGPTWTFHTTPGADPVFVGVGDIAACTVTEDTATGNIVQGIDGVVFTTGDDVYYTGTAEEYANCYATTPWGSASVLSRTRPIAGNHDWGLGTRNTLEYYFAYFGANATDAGGNSYYSYNIDSNWHVVNLETECALVGGCNAGSPQEIWLQADLAANSTKNVIALIHKPRYSSGTTNLQELQPLWDDLYAAGVDILLDGHDHIYERLAPMKSGATPASPPVADPLYGIRQFTVGTGGESHHGLGTTLPTSEVLNNTTYGIFKLTLHATTYDWEFLPIAGSTFTDSGTGTVHGPPSVGTTTTISFQDGVASYAGTRDTYIYDVNPGTVRGAETTMVQDKNTGDERRSLLLFDLSSIPTDATIVSSELQFYVDTEGQGFNMHRMLASWDEATVTYTSIGNRHFAADNVDAESSVNANWPGVDTYIGYITVSVPASTIQDWVDGTLANNGWLMIATHADDGQQLRTREHATVADRPKLTVEYSVSTTSPTITVTGTPLAAFSSEPGTPSAEQSYTVSGSNLTEDIVITAPSDFEISTISGSGFGSGLTLSQSGGSVAATTIYVRFNRATVGTSTGDITHTSSGATTQNVAVSGNAGSTGTGLSFDGTNDYVTFGQALDLGVTDFTLETWFYWTGGGVATTTSTTQGLPSVIPLISKGRGEADGDNRDMNYFLGVVPTTNKLAADFEDMASGLNHPFTGNTTITTNAWHHAAVTYDSTSAVWTLYLDGALDSTTDLGSNVLPRSDSVQHAGLASAMTSSGVAAGYFQGRLDEARIWNYARSQTEIMAAINSELTSGTGLVARWGMGEGSGTTIASSVGTFNGTLSNGPTWVAGAPFNIAPPSVPAAPTLLSATPTAGLQIDLSWTDNSTNETSFKVERSPDGSAGWTQIGTTAANVSTFSNGGLDPATQYCYRVRASNSVGDSDNSNVSCGTTPGEPNNGLNLGSGTAYVGFGDPAALDLAQFTIETWFKRTGAGASNTTGTDGIPNAIPLVTHGAPQAEGSNVDANWVLVIDDAADVIAADFEDMATGLNHPVLGTTVITNNVWHHAAATYDGTTWRLYLDGNLETTLAVNQTPRSDSTQLSGLGAMFTTTGTALGHFDGTLDEVRVWNYPRTETQIQGTMNSPITSPQSGLVARWGLNETTGTAVPSSAGTSVNGTITGAGYLWGAGAPAIVNHLPAVALDSPINGATNVSTSPTLNATVTDPDLDEQTVSFYGRLKNPAPGADFTIIPMPDTQHYTDNGGSNAANFSAQTQWIVDNKDSRNIVFVTGLGDIVENGDTNDSEWQIADGAYGLIEDPLTTFLADGIPYGLAVGNHDQSPIGGGSTASTSKYNQYFGISRFNGRGYYGGHYGSDNDNNYELFSASGMDFIIIHFEYDTTPELDVLNWADSLLTTYSDRRAILTTHYMIDTGNPGAWGAQGQAIYNALSDHPNVFLMLGGHVPGEGRRQDTAVNGNVVNTLLSDYQSRANGGDGWLRIMTFSPANNTISIQTYSPVLGQYETDADSQFTLSYTMAGAPAAFQLIGTDSAPSGGTASVTWNGLANGAEYEWYAETRDGIQSASSAISAFTTETGSNQAPVITEGTSADVTMSEDGAPTPFNLTLHATDADAGDTLTWSVSTQASNGSASAAGTGPSKDITYTPNANFNGTDSFVVQVSDGNGGTDTITVNVTVAAVNDPPDVTNPGTRTNAEGDTVSLQIQASDVDVPAQTLTYSASNLPTGLSINAASGLISGTVDFNASASSPHPVQVVVSDGAGGSTPVDFTWNVSDAAPPPGGLSCTTLDPKPLTAGTGEKPQSKVWYHAGAWWAVFPTDASGASSAGTWLWKLQGTTWTEALKLSTRTDVKADAKVSNDVVHVLLYAGTNTELVSAEYNSGTYGLWTSRPTPSPLSLSGSEIATIDIDSAGRMWLATENDATAQIVVYYSDSPYSTWSGPITLASGVHNDDISVVVKLPNQIGVLWSNQNTERFGFRIHNDADAFDVWGTDEVPASQSAIIDPTAGMADDHLNVKVASDGTLYAAVKTSYDTAGYTKVALLVRRPSGAWDDLYHVDYAGTRGNIELDEANGVLTYLYTQAEGFNPIVYKQSNLNPISFGPQMTLRTESFNDVSSTKQNYNNQLVVIYGSSTEVAGQICTGVPASGADLSITKTDGLVTVRPNDTLTYTITVTNNGPEAATGATVADSMPAALNTVSWTCTASGGASCAANGTDDINDTVDLPIGSSLTYSVAATVDLGARGDLSNTATVSAPAGITDPLLGNNTATDTDAIITGGATCEDDPTLVGCWPMEEGSGSVLIDGSSFNNDANVYGGPAWVTGKVGTYALDLDGTSQYALVPDDASLDPTDQITLAAWIKPEQYATQDLIKKATIGSTNGYELTLAQTKTDASSQRAFFRINQVSNGDTYRINAVTMYPIDGTWMHVAATFDGTTMKLYINGALESSLTPPAGTTIAPNNLPLSIGAQDGATASRYYMGWMDEARVYNRALNASEIRALYGNHPPEAIDDAYNTGQDTVLDVAAPGLLLNDTDVDSDPLTAVKVTDPANGDLTLNSDGSFTYTPNSCFTGDDTFTYKANDGEADSNVATVTVSVSLSNQPPVANAGGPYNADLGSSVVLNGSGSSDPNAGCGDSIVSYQWDIDNDGAYDDLTGLAPTITASQIDALGVGSHPIHLRVTDEFGATGTASTTLAIYDNRPFASITVNPNPAACGQSVTFDASGSYHGRPDRSIVSYSWDFGDGGTATGQTTTHAYPVFGSYTAALTITDDNVPAKTDSKTVPISVNQGNQPPVANAGGPYTADLGSELVLDGTSSSDPNAGCGDSIVSYEWDINNDGSYDLTGSQPTITASQIDTLGVGSHTIRLRVTDEFGVSGTALTTLAIYDNRPFAVIVVNPNPAACGQAVTFDASGSYHGRPDRSIVSYSWDFGDGGTATGQTTTHAYSAFGSYTTTLTITDDNVPPKTDSNTLLVSVTLGNQPPAANAGGPYTADLGSSLMLNGSGSSDPNAGCGDSIVSYQWDIDNDGAYDDLTGSAPTITASQIDALGVGSHTISLRVTDEFGASGTAATTLAIYDNRPFAVIVVNPNPAACGQSVTFDASGSYHGRPDRSIVSYSWDFGDGSSATGVSVSHAYSSCISHVATLTVTDDNVPAKTDSSTITIDIINTAPVAVDDTYNTDEDVTLTVAAPGVLTNDTDVNGASLTAIKITDPTHGALELNADGSFIYVPDAGFAGEDSFTYKANDGTADSNTATVSIEVAATNRAPVAADDSYATDEDTLLTISAPGVLTNDTDADGNSLTAVIVSYAAHGTLTFSADGSFTYTPAANWNGSDSFTYKANDGTLDSNVATVSITVNAVNDAPAADDQSVTTPEDTPIDITLTGSDVEGSTLTFSIADGPLHGVLSGTAPNATYTPAANYNGPDSFTFKVNDGTVDSNTATISIIVPPVNDDPVAVNDSYSTDEDVALSIAAPGVLGNDTDVEGNSLTAVLVDGPAHGTLTLNANGSFTYTPAAGYSGPDSFTYLVNDGETDSNVATVAIAVSHVDHAPVAVNDNYSTDEDTPLNIATPGLLDNDTDDDGDTLTAIKVTGPSHGALTFNGDGSFTYTPDANWNGPDSFTYKANDGSLDSNTATVNITVHPVNDAPVANDQALTTAEDTAKAITLTASDLEGSALTFTVVGNPAHGSLSGTAPDLTYSPDANYNGADSFTFKVNDGELDSNTATVSITVTPVNDTPVATDDSYSTNRNVALTIAAPGVLSNDTDAESDPLTAVLVAGPSNGTLVLNADGSFTYTPAANYAGSDSFTYKANDGSLDSNVATVTISVAATNRAPVAADDNYSTAEDTLLTIAAPGVLGNDTDADGNALTAALVSGPAHGTLVLLTDGSFTFTPAANWSGSDSFTYKANDGTVDSNTATVAITVNAVNDAPVAADDSYTIDEDTPLTIAAPGVLGNDSDVEGSSLTSILANAPSAGTLTLNGDGSFTYTPVANWSGTDLFTYKANDGTADSNSATVRITVAPVNDPPVAVDDSYSTDEDTPLLIAAPGVLSNDTDVDNSMLSAVKISDPSHGSLTLNADGSFTYTAAAGYSGADSFTYKANDSSADSNVATVNISVRHVNHAPAAVDDSYSTGEDSSLTIAAKGVLTNDTDVDNDTLAAALVAGPAHGTLLLNADGSFTYTPAANWSDSDSFTYTANDGTTDSNIATVTITVNPVNDAPTANDQNVTTAEDTAKALPLTGSDVEGSPLSFIIVSGPAHGSLSGTAPDVTYSPDANFNGPDSFTFKVNDGDLDSPIATVTITVTSVNDAPVSADDSYDTNRNVPLTVATPGVLGNDTDVDNVTLTAVLVSGPSHGTLTLSAGGSFTYTPDANYAGMDSFTYKANDGLLDSNLAAVTINVAATNRAPVAVNDSYATDEDTPLIIAASGVLGNDTDEDGNPLTAVLVSGPAHGTLTLNAGGSFTYAPDANWNGSDSFTYKANDGTVDSNVATVAVTVNPVNDAPAAADDSYITNEDTPLTIAAPGVLGNDTDVEGSALSTILVAGPSHGALLLNADGSFSYTSETNWSGSDSFNYKASDGSLASNAATVSVTVNSINDPPVANNDSAATPQDTPVTITVLANDSDADSDSLIVTAVSIPDHGSAVINMDSTVMYTPVTGWSGSDSFTYTISDGQGGTATAIVNVSVAQHEVTVTFQNDVAGYTGSVDTHIMEAEPTTDHGALGSVEWDADDPPGTAQDKYALIRFDDIFGPGPGQIPLGATIQSATLRYEVFNIGNPADVNEVTVDWTESVPWNSFGGDPGVQPDEYGASLGTANGDLMSLKSVDVTSSLITWSNNPSMNKGWIFRPTGSDGVDFRSSEYTTIASRPSLEVIYLTGGPVEQFNLTVNTTGNGSVTLNPPGGTYPAGMLVQLTAEPAAGYAFNGWSGDLSGTSNPISIVMDAGKTVTASFTQNEYTLTIVSAHGTVTKNPDQATYHYGDVVQLTATPAAGWNFANWSGDASGSANPVSVTIDGDKAVTANYTQIQYTLTVDATGSGTVTKDPDQTNYHYGDVVQLTATPASGWTFSGWSGDASGSANPLNILMDGNKSITATFTRNTYTLDITVVGSGTVTKNPNQSSYLSGTSVELTATPASGWTFAGWSGAASGTTNPISIVMDGNKSVTATFTSGANVIFADGFESGDFSKWSSCVTDAGDLSVGADAKYAGNFGMKGLIDDNIAIYCTSDHPNAEPRYVASFYFDPNSISMVGGDTHLIFGGYSGTSTLVLRVQFRKLSTSYLVRASIRDDASNWRDSSWFTISDAYHQIKVDWQASSAAGANNGRLTLWIDSNQVADLTAVDNDTRRIDSGRLGAVNELDTGTRGAYFFDEFESSRGTGGPEPTATLTVNKTGAGSGTVTSSPAGIVCGSTCSYSFNTNTVVTLTVTAASGSTFTGWSGAGCSGTGTCVITLTADTSVTANFNLQSSSSTLTVNKTGTGSGTVTSSPSGIDCGSTCSYSFTNNTVVTLTATAASGSTFTGWSDAGCSGTGACIVTMTAATSVTANFDLTSPADVIFADGFESGALSAWSSSTTNNGDLSVSTAATLAGNYGMQALINDNNSIYVTDDSPNAEARYRAGFYFDPNSISMSSGNAHFIFAGMMGSSTAVLRVEFRYSSGVYQIRARLLNDGSSWTNSNWFTITDAKHFIELDWRASTAVGANNGGVTLWIDGFQQANLTGVDNDTRRIDRARLGAVTGIDRGTRGTYYFDAFESRRQTYIGP